ncbi:MAG: cytochrome c class I [Bacteroidetes bacterium]|nr:MAG: cytochrome c class I [Bacteroidota bacterium]
MNCQNCHLDAGTRPFGNNYGAVSSTYPKFRGRSASMESIPKRVSDCFERSLNGKSPDPASREMQAIIAYINWLGSNVKKTEKPLGFGIIDLPFLSRAADTVKGKLVYDTHCSSCHQPGGQGVMNVAGTGYTYPPLWGEHSYNIGAGLFRLSRFAGYVKYNMPQGVTYVTPKLTDEEAWDVAAYVNSRQRPFKDLSGDWPDISAKPADHPFGPFTDSFSEQQHKFGPFDIIADAQKKGGKK